MFERETYYFRVSCVENPIHSIEYLNLLESDDGITGELQNRPMRFAVEEWHKADYELKDVHKTGNILFVSDDREEALRELHAVARQDKTWEIFNKPSWWPNFPSDQKSKE